MIASIFLAIWYVRMKVNSTFAAWGLIVKVQTMMYMYGRHCIDARDILKPIHFDAIDVSKDI